MHIAVLANLKRNAPTWDGMSEDQWDDLDSPKTIDSLVAALETRGHQVEFLEASILPPYDLVTRLLAAKPDLCFNIAEGHFGDGREAQVPAILEMLQIPYTGSKVMTLALTLDKPMTKRVLWYHGLPTPEFQVFDQEDEPLDEDLLDEDEELRYPMFVKPSREGTSMGVSAQSVVTTVEELYTQVKRQLERYRQPILVEHYIKGREITVGMLGNITPPAARRISDHTAPNVLPEGLTFFPALEIDTGVVSDSEGELYTNRMKVEWADNEKFYICPAPLEPDFVHQLQLLAAAVFRVTGCKDVARVDFRLDEENDNKPYILEVNPLPGLNPGYSDLCIQAKAAGWSYSDLVNTIVEHAVTRQGLPIQGG